jgi:hypothetical protein
MYGIGVHPRKGAWDDPELYRAPSLEETLRAEARNTLAENI